MLRALPITCAILVSSVASLLADTYTSAGSGLWNATAPETWTPNGNPQTGSIDSVSILTGHTVIFEGTSPVGVPGSNDLGVAGGQTISIDGGVLSQTPANFWIRIGHGSEGTLNINDGRFHFTDNTGSASPNLQIGIRAGGTGTVNIGDGIGPAGSAILNLRDIVDGTANTANVSMNLAATETNQSPGIAGAIVINSDGVLEGDMRVSNANPTIRVGQGASTTESSLTVNAGGQFRAHGNVEAAAAAGSLGRIHLNGTGARMDMDDGEFTIGFNGSGALTIENNAVFSKTHSTIGRLDIYIGREAPGTGNVVVQSGGQLLRGAGGNVGDLRIGLRGTGTFTVNDGGLVENAANNWDWVGQEGGSNGTLTINQGGVWRAVSTASANLNIGVNANATGLVVVNGGTVEYLNPSTNSNLQIAQNGNGTFRQVSGTSNFRTVRMAENDGSATFELQGGTFTSRSSFFIGGAAAASAGAGTATATQSGGTLNAGGAFVVGLATGHSGSFTMTGGILNHTGSDITVGESGTGFMRVGTSGVVNDTSGGQFLVGRNEGSAGTLYVDGSLTKTSANPIRVGNGDVANPDTTTAPGLLGGTGSIVATGGVRIGAHGTLTGGDFNSVGTLSITGPLNFTPNGILHMNFEAAEGADRIAVNGTINISGAILSGTWNGGETGLDSRYWLMVNDGFDPITGLFSNVSPTSPFSDVFPDADGWVTIGSQDFAVNYSADFDTTSITGGNDLLLRAVPEPGSASLVMASLALLGMRRRRAAAK